MAILEELYTETKNEEYQFLDVQILPKSVDEKGLWRIEAGLQLSRDKRLDYSPINQLLKLEEGVNAGLLPEEERQIEELHALLEFPAEEIAAQLDEETEKAEKVLPRVISFVVTPEQEEIIQQAVEMASDGTPGRDRKARGLTNLAKIYLEETSRETRTQ